MKLKRTVYKSKNKEAYYVLSTLNDVIVERVDFDTLEKVITYLDETEKQLKNEGYSLERENDNMMQWIKEKSLTMFIHEVHEWSGVIYEILCYKRYWW